MCTIHSWVTTNSFIALTRNSMGATAPLKDVVPHSAGINLPTLEGCKDAYTFVGVIGGPDDWARDS